VVQALAAYGAAAKPYHPFRELLAEETDETVRAELARTIAALSRD
jgi:hypothetical protein